MILCNVDDSICSFRYSIGDVNINGWKQRPDSHHLTYNFNELAMRLWHMIEVNATNLNNKHHCKHGWWQICGHRAIQWQVYREDGQVSRYTSTWYVWPALSQQNTSQHLAGVHQAMLCSGWSWSISVRNGRLCSTSFLVLHITTMCFRLYTSTCRSVNGWTHNC